MWLWPDTPLIDATTLDMSLDCLMAGDTYEAAQERGNQQSDVHQDSDVPGFNREGAQGTGLRFKVE